MKNYKGVRQNLLSILTKQHVSRLIDLFKISTEEATKITSPEELFSCLERRNLVKEKELLPLIKKLKKVGVLVLETIDEYIIVLGNHSDVFFIAVLPPLCYLFLELFFLRFTVLTQTIFLTPITDDEYMPEEQQERERESREQISTDGRIVGHLLTNKHTQNKHTHYTHTSTHSKTLAHT